MGVEIADSTTQRAELAAAVFEERQRVKDALEKTGALELTQTDRQVRAVAATANSAAYVQITEVRVLPFPFDAVSDEIWAFLGNASLLEQQGKLSRDVGFENDVLHAETNLQYTATVGDGTLMSTAAFSKAFNADHMALAYVSHGKIERNGNKGSPFVVIEKGWTLIEPTGSNTAECILRCVSHLEPRAVDGAITVKYDEDSDEIQTLKELGEGVYSQTTTYIYSLVEQNLSSQ
ncbi:TPA: hypothetical protein N0F65_004787 [Lagenidium giganteum]|uniref:Uncharacterized protein n=1 Tax=Lagenidium giganteum TaxID=4803 RepID=A0AAV2Z640_9STRA|nr:TPA: hypothetical protein N0F65_004787 [Lagenidium giganteum]